MKSIRHFHLWTQAFTIYMAVIIQIPKASASPVDEFYRGKRISILVGFGSGGGYDVYARLLAKHLGRYIPEEPAVIVQNMPGAGSLLAANYLFNVAPKDGTVIGTFERNIPLMGLLGGNSAVKFDAEKFIWLGSLSQFSTDAIVPSRIHCGRCT
jgi:tripartite-type tricarboxylate transporter receptor subunit TctC